MRGSNPPGEEIEEVAERDGVTTTIEPTCDMGAGRDTDRQYNKSGSFCAHRAVDRGLEGRHS